MPQEAWRREGTGRLAVVGHLGMMWHAERGSSPDVASQADSEPSVPHSMVGKLATLEEEIGIRAVGNGRLSFCQNRDFLFREVDGVAHDGVGAKDSQIGIDLGVGSFAKQLLNPGDFIFVL